MTVGLLSFVKQIFSGSNQRLNINVANEGTHYLNIAKQFVWNADPTIINADGYPTTLPATSLWSCGMGLTPGYYGSWTWSWTGTASMEISGPTLLVPIGRDLLWIGWVNRRHPGQRRDEQPNQSHCGDTIRLEHSIHHAGRTGRHRNQGRRKNLGWLLNCGLLSSTIQMQIAGANSNTGANGNWTAVAIDTTSFYLQGIDLHQRAGVRWRNCGLCWSCYLIHFEHRHIFQFCEPHLLQNS